jgi:hypothetical protein
MASTKPKPKVDDEVTPLVVPGTDPETGEPTEGPSENLMVHAATGVLLDKNDPFYADLLEVENLRGELLEELRATTAESVAVDDNVRAAQMQAEKARLRADLASARAAREASGGGVSGLLANIDAQRQSAEQTEQAARAAAGEGN